MQRWLRLAAHLGAPAKGGFLEFPLQPQDWDEWRGALRLENYVLPALRRAAAAPR